jgi:hypothetical protein
MGQKTLVLGKNLVVARLLLPRHFGVIAMLGEFIPILEILLVQVHQRLKSARLTN